MKIENKKRNNQIMLSDLKPGTPFVFTVDNDSSFDNLAIITNTQQYVYLSDGQTFDINDNDGPVCPVINAKIVFD